MKIAISNTTKANIVNIVIFYTSYFEGFVQAEVYRFLIKSLEPSPSLDFNQVRLFIFLKSFFIKFEWN